MTLPNVKCFILIVRISAENVYLINMMLWKRYINFQKDAVIWECYCKHINIISVWPQHALAFRCIPWHTQNCSWNTI